MPRLFVGIDLPAAVKSLLLLLCAGMPEARWVEPERFHLTLRFIGAVDDAMAHDIEAALQRIEASPFALASGGCRPLSRTQPVGWRGAEPSFDVSAR